MAGIIANSPSVSMAVSEGADISKSGFVAGELITLTADPPGSVYQWTVAGADVTAQEAQATVAFKASEEGVYVAVCVVDGATTYVMRLDVSKVEVDWAASGVRMIPAEPSDIPTPSSGYVMFLNASNSDALSLKDSSGIVSAV